jgi:hypothetical protein
MSNYNSNQSLDEIINEVSKNKNYNKINYSDVTTEPNSPSNEKKLLTEENLLPSDLLNDEITFEEEQKKEEQNEKKFQNQTIIKPNEKNNFSDPIAYNIFLQKDMKLFLAQVKTHQGSIYLQYLLQGLNENDINNFIQKYQFYLIDIMCNHYGNYFIQKLFQRLNFFQRIFIFNLIKRNFLHICIDKSGTYSIQSLIDVIRTPQEEKILENLLCQNLLLLFCNENSQHVIQKIIIDFPEHKREYLNKFLFNNIDKICNNLYGSLCTIKFIIMNSNLYIRYELLRIIQMNFLSLINNQFGCSVLLFVLERFGLNYCNFMINLIRENFFYLINKNNNCIILIEKIISYLKNYNINYYNEFIWLIINNENIIITLLQNDFGKNLFFNIIKNSSIEQKKKIKFTLKNNIYLQNTLIFDKIKNVNNYV